MLPLQHQRLSRCNLASFPGPPQLFNVARRKARTLKRSGSLGTRLDVTDTCSVVKVSSKSGEIVFYLVREDVFNLSKFFVKSGGPGNRRDILRLIVHFAVPID